MAHGRYTKKRDTVWRNAKRSREQRVQTVQAQRLEDKRTTDTQLRPLWVQRAHSNTLPANVTQKRY